MNKTMKEQVDKERESNRLKGLERKKWNTEATQRFEECNKCYNRHKRCKAVFRTWGTNGHCDMMFVLEIRENWKKRFPNGQFRPGDALEHYCNQVKGKNYVYCVALKHRSMVTKIKQLELFNV